MRLCSQARCHSMAFCGITRSAPRTTYGHVGYRFPRVMYYSPMRFQPALRWLTGAITTIMTILGFSLSGTALAAANTFCSSGTTTYSGANGGQWGTGDNWTNGQPSAQCAAVIPTNSTVTLSTVTQAGSYGNGAAGAAGGLTISPGATLIVAGVASDVQGNGSNATTLFVGAQGLMIDSGATLDLEATGNTQAGSPAGYRPGGSANLTVDSGASGPAKLINEGKIVTSSSDPAWGESINVGGTVTNAGSITDQSGLLTLQGQQVPYIFDNKGTFTIRAGGSFTMLAGNGSFFTNTGKFVNLGTAKLQQSMYWYQNGGTVTGNPLEFTGGETLKDSSGAGKFEITNCATTGLIGAVPVNQTITVLGGCSGTTLYLGGSTSKAPVVNHGTIVLDAPAGGSDAIIAGAELVNHGTLDANVGAARSLANQLLVPLANESSATVNLSGGELEQTTGSATTNAGTVNVVAGATWLVQSGSFTNRGTLALQIVGRTKFGSLNLTAGGKFNAGGKLAVRLASGYKPAAKTEFPIVAMNGGSPHGTFATVTGGFRADYAKETAKTPYLGVIY